MEIKCYLSNCILGINEKISFNISGYDIDLIQNENYTYSQLNDYKGKWLDSTYLVFNISEEKEITNVKNIAENISYLLSMATLSPVRFYRFDKDNTFDHTEHARNGNFNFFRPLINLLSGSDIKNYLETTFDNFEKLKEKRQLNVVIEYLISSETLKMPLELKLSTIFILLENLKKTYAEECKYHYIMGSYYKSYYYNKKNERYGDDKLHFNTLLEEMFNKFNINKEVKSIVNLRNEIIHSGLSQMSYSEQYRIYEDCHDLVHLYLLKLLNYRGDYLVYSRASRKIEEL